MGGSKGGGDQTIGFRYYLSLHMGLCRGPIDEIVRINAGDLPMWPYPDGDTSNEVPLGGILYPSGVEGTEEEPTLLVVAKGPGNTGVQQFSDGGYKVVSAGEVTTISNTGDYTVDAPELFGGEKKEGGIAGSLRSMMGLPDQVVPLWIKNLMGGRVPGFRGVVTLFFDGMLTAMNPYPKKWEFRVRRTESGWDGDVWQPTLVTIWMRDGTIKAMNGAHILYECFTNRDWGRGLPRSALLDSTFVASAQTLFDEQFGLCLRYSRQSELSEFIAEVIDHIGGAVFPDPATGKLSLTLLRGDYDPNEIPLFDYNSGLIAVEEGDTVSQDAVVNEIITKWTDPIAKEERSSRVQNIASIQASGAPNSNTVSYAGVPTVDLSLRLGQRDIKAGAAALKRYTVTLDRRGVHIAPGSVFRISAPSLNIYNAVLRAGQITHSGARDGKIKVEATLDVYGLPSASFVEPEAQNWNPSNRNAQEADRRVVRESTYAEFVRAVDPANLEILPVDAGAVTAIAGKPTSLSLAYQIATKADGEDKWTRGTGTFSPYVLAAADLPAESLSVVPFVGGVDIGLVEIGCFVQMGDEIGRLDDLVYDPANGTGTATIARGCVDTIPVPHADGDTLFFVKNEVGADGRQFVSGEDVDVKLLTYTSSNKLKLTLAPTDTVAMTGRQGRPYPPGKVLVNGLPFYEPQSLSGDISINWSHRNRITQQDQLVAHDAGSIASEFGTTYTLRVYDGDTTTAVRTFSAITGTSAVYTAAMAASDGISGNLWFELESERESLVSTQRYRFEVGYTPAP